MESGRKPDKYLFGLPLYKIETPTFKNVGSMPDLSEAREQRLQILKRMAEMLKNGFGTKE